MLKPSEKWHELADKLENQHMEIPINTFRDFLYLSHLIEKYLNAKLNNIDGINRTQRMIITFLLLKRGFITPTEISKMTLYSVDTLNKSIDVLDKKGITKSYSSRKDRRIRRVTLTEKGLDLAEKKILPARHLTFSEAMDCFTENDMKKFQSLLERLREQALHILEKDGAKSKKADATD